MYKNLIKDDHYTTQKWNAIRFIKAYQSWGFRHKGIDFGTHDKRVPCYAITNGRIIYAGENGGWGNYVELYDPILDKIFQYAHLDSINVEANQKVKVGTEIGIIGTTGISTGIHLHFGVYSNNGHKKKYENPIPYLEKLIKPLTEIEMIIKNLSKLQKKKIEDLEKGNTVLAFAEGKAYVIRNSKKKELPVEEALINVLAAGTTKEDIDKIPNN